VNLMIFFFLFKILKYYFLCNWKQKALVFTRAFGVNSWRYS